MGDGFQAARRDKREVEEGDRGIRARQTWSVMWNTSIGDSSEERLFYAH